MKYEQVNFFRLERPIHRRGAIMGDMSSDKHKNRDRIVKLNEINNEAEGFSFSIENIMTDQITNGDIDGLTETLSRMDVDDYINHLYESEDSERDAIRTFQNLLIGTNTYCRIAAKNGEVIPLILYLISQRFTILIENADSLDYLKEYVFFDMPKEYCQAVCQYSAKDYSQTMKDIVYEISQNLTDNLTLKEIAQRHDMHPVHLARKFKTETGITFIAYINELRISLAKYYFHLDEYRLNEVVDLAGFNSHSYFTKVFKKLTGITPTKYIRQLPHLNK